MYMAGMPVPPLPVVVPGRARAAPASSSSSSADSDSDDEHAHVRCRPAAPEDQDQDQDKDQDADEEVVASSFDVIANGVLVAMVRDDPRANERRRRRQERLRDRLLAAVAVATTVDQAYQAFQAFTADYICAFDEGPEVAVRFLPLHDDRADRRLRHEAAHWLAAHDVLHRPPPEQRPYARCAALAYPELIAAAAEAARRVARP